MLSLSLHLFAGKISSHQPMCKTVNSFQEGVEKVTAESALISWFYGQIESKTTKLQLCQGCLPQGRFRAPDIITTGRNYLLDCDYSVDFLYFLLSCEKCSQSLNLRSASKSAFTHLDVRADCNNERLKTALTRTTNRKEKINKL